MHFPDLLGGERADEITHIIGHRARDDLQQAYQVRLIVGAQVRASGGLVQLDPTHRMSTAKSVHQCGTHRGRCFAEAILESVPVPEKIILPRAVLQSVREQDNRRGHETAMILIGHGSDHHKFRVQNLHILHGHLALLIVNDPTQCRFDTRRDSHGEIGKPGGSHALQVR